MSDKYLLSGYRLTAALRFIQRESLKCSRSTLRRRAGALDERQVTNNLEPLDANRFQGAQPDLLADRPL